jgi:hypothetical protein
MKGFSMKSTTNGYKRLHGMTPEQEAAADLIAVGKTDAEVASAVGCHWVTVTRWRLRDPVFQAGVNRRRREVFGASLDRLRALVPKALDVLENRLESGSEKAALALLRLSGLDLMPPPEEPIDGEEIIRKEIDKRTGELVAERRKYQSLEVGLEEMQDPQKARERDLECRAQAESEVMEKLRERITM